MIQGMIGRHVAGDAKERRVALAILFSGSAAALASLFGDPWVVRGGVVIAIAMAFAAFYFTTRELRRAREQHRQEMREQLEIRRADLRRHHAESMAMMDRYGARIAASRSTIAELKRQVDAANAELSTLRGNAVLLRSEVAVRQARIKQLEAAIVQLESQLTEQTGRTTQNLVSLPKRGQVLSGDDVREAVATPVTITRYHA